MSARPQRTKNPIKRLNKEQAINALQVRSRVKKTGTKATPSRQKKKVPKLPPGGKKARVLSILDSLKSGKNPKIYNMLYSIYRDASGTLFNRINLNDEQFAKSIEQQYNVMKVNIRESGLQKDPNKVNIKLEKGGDKLELVGNRCPTKAPGQFDLRRCSHERCIVLRFHARPVKKRMDLFTKSTSPSRFASIGRQRR